MALSKLMRTNLFSGELKIFLYAKSFVGRIPMRMFVSDSKSSSEPSMAKTAIKLRLIADYLLVTPEFGDQF